MNDCKFWRHRQGRLPGHPQGFLFLRRWTGYRWNEKFARQVKRYFSHRHTGLELKEIGRWYGISESGVTQASRRIRSRMDEDREFAGRIEKIAHNVNV